VWFRTGGDAEWRKGTSRSVSKIGAVVESDDPPSVSDTIAVVIALSDTGCLAGRGRVVRTCPSAGPTHPACFSIAVDHYALGHRTPLLMFS
jgi:hypothetical protein